MPIPLYFYSHRPRDNDIYKSHVFSQWFSSKMKENENEYWCCEQYMMAKKALLFAKGSFKDVNMKIYEQIMNANKQDHIKALGRTVKGFDEKIWENNRLHIVIEGNYLKFSQNQELRKILIDTGYMELAEASPYDKIWGIGLDIETAKKSDKSKWKGLNLLGVALMTVREGLVTQEKIDPQ